MKKYLILIALLIILSGCAFGVYDGRGFHGVAIGVSYPYHEPYSPEGYYGGYSYGHGYRNYPSAPGRYYRGPGYPGHYR